MPFFTDLRYRFRRGALTRRRSKLLVVFHGQGDVLDPFLSLPKELELEEFDYLFLEAPHPYEGGFQWARDHRLKQDLAQLRQNLTLLFFDLFSHGYRPQDIFLFGLSQGAMVATHLMMKLPLSFGGVVAVSGYIYFSKTDPTPWTPISQQTPFLMTHGKRDREIPLAIAFRHFQKLKRLGFQGEWWEFNKGHVIDDRVEGPMIGQWISLLAESPLKPSLSVPSFEETFAHVE